MSRSTDNYLAIFTRQLASMASMSLPLAGSLKVLEASAPTNRLRLSIEEMRQDVEKGRQLSEAAARQKHLFPKHWCMLAAVGERTNGLAEMLRTAAEICSKINLIRRKTLLALFTPLLVIILLAVDVAIIGFLVRPSMTAFVESQHLGNIFYGGSANRGTVEGVNPEIFIEFIYLGGMFFLCVTIASLVWIAWGTGCRVLDRWILNVPLWGMVLRQAHASVISHALGLMIERGIPLPQALEWCASLSPNRAIGDSLLLAKREVESGGNLSAGLRVYPVFTAWVQWAVGSFERHGNLANGLGWMSKQLEFRTTMALKVFTEIAEPVLFFLAGSSALFILWTQSTGVFGIVREIFRMFR